MARFWIAAVLGLALTAPAFAADADHDPHKTRAQELRTFLPLLCTRITSDKNGNCEGIIGVPSFAGSTQILSLNTVAYGAFTRAGADQAYVSYTSSFEGHVSNFGGGILFERKAGAWRQLRWYSGGQMDQCVALPPGAVQRMLCLTGYTGMGETDTSVWIYRVPDKAQADNALITTAMVRAQDARGVNASGNYQCTLKRAAGEGILLSVSDLTRSHAPGVVAQSRIRYAAPADAKAACAANRFAKVKETQGVVLFRVRNGQVVAQARVPFARTDY